MSHSIDTSKNKYILYARKSTESDERQVASTADQIKVMKRAIEREDSRYKIITTFEEQKSGFIPYRREKFDKMIQMLRDGEAQGIITWKMSRLSRNPEESGIIMGMLQRGEIAHIYTSDRTYLPGDNIIVSAFEFAMSNQSSIETSKDTKRGLGEKAERGWCPHSVLPIGYQHVEYLHVGIDPEIIPDQERFDLFRQGVMQIIEGKMEPRQAHKWLTEQGLRTKKTRTKPESVLPWSTFYRLLGDRFYVGEFVWKDKVHQGKHKPMFTEDEFDRLQFMMGRLEQADEAYYITASLLLDLASRSYELFIGSEPDDKREIIQLTLQNLSLNHGKLEYTLQKSFDSIFVSAKSHKWGRWLNSVRTFIATANPNISNFKFYNVSV